MKTELTLNGIWKLEGWDPYDRSKRYVLDGIVPGQVHSDLWRAGIIPDPFWRDQANECQWVERWQWRYTRQFTISEEHLSEWMLLSFEGLDTFAHIVLNGVTIGTSDTMFVPQEFEVTSTLRPGVNELEVTFVPSAEAVKDQPIGTYVSLFSPERIFVRRMQCGFGWDWVHRFVSAGIWRPVRVIRYQGARITNVYLPITALSKDEATLTAQVELENRRGEHLQVRLEIVDPCGTIVTHRVVEASTPIIPVPMAIPHPKLWWPNGFGDQPLYTCRCTLTDVTGQVLDQHESEVGIRTVEMIETPDGYGQSMVLHINGEPVFAKGANWVPADPFPGTIPVSHYDHLLRLARDGHVNMLRAWGGGIYEPEAFWKACDHWGIMVMQDFMLACAWYPEDDPEFMRQLSREFECIIRRLRNHPSLVMWVGDNELGMNEPADSPFNGRRIADEVSGPLCHRLDPSRPFRKTSPYGGTPNNATTEGDCHISSWLNREFQLSDMRDYRERLRDVWGRFVSEYVTMGMPCIETQRRYASEADLRDPEGRILAFHNKDNPYNGIDHADHFGMMRQTALNLYGDTSDPLALFARMEYEQYEWIRLACESLRRRKFDCAGLLFWMYNDCWPANGCSIVDYYGHPKAAYYAMKSGFQPIIAALEPLDGHVAIWVVNDTRQGVSGMVTLYFQPFSGSPLWKKQVTIGLDANTSRCVATVPKAEITTEGVLVCDVETVRGHDRAWYFMGLPREMLLPTAHVTATFDNPEHPHNVELTTDAYARVVTLSGPVIPSDNYFDMLPGERRSITLQSRGEPVSAEQLSIAWWNAPVTR